MTVKEFKELFKGSTMRFYDLNGKDITSKPEIILNIMKVVGSGHNADGSIDVDVA